MNNFTAGMISVSLAIASASTASACNVGAGVTRANFIKLTQCVNTLEAQVQSLQTTISQMNTSKGRAAIKALDPGVPRNLGGYGGFSGTLNLDDDRVVCPPGTWVSGIQGFKNSGGFSGIEGEPQPLSELRYSCRGLK
jgi:hypothetical protein